MAQRFSSFTDVQRLDAESLKALLVGGEPPERVWAAWALGLRHHEMFARELRATAAEEPHAGVRRHLVVVLAGAGERRSVFTMAAHDPDERVRATALQYVARLAGPRDDDANDLLADALAHGTPLQRLGCIAGLQAGARPALWEAVEACVGSTDRDLRWAAYDAAIRRGAGPRAPELARVLLNGEPERNTRAEALRLLQEHAGPDEIRRLITDGPLEARVFSEVVDALPAGVSLSWNQVEPLVARYPADQDRALRLLAGNEGPARPALLQMFVASCQLRNRWQEWEVDEEILVRLRGALDQNRGPLDPVERRLRQELADFVDKQADEARDNPEAFYDGDDPDWPEERPEGPFDPLAFASFRAPEREVLARLAALEVH